MVDFFSDQNRNGQLKASELLVVRIIPQNKSISVRLRKPGYLFYKNDGSAWPNAPLEFVRPTLRFLHYW